LRPLEGVRELRERRMLSQQELANRAGVSLFTVQRIERGEGSVRPKTGRAIAAALGVAVEDLLGKAQAPLPNFEVQERRGEIQMIESCRRYAINRAEYYEQELERGRTTEYSTAEGACTLACLSLDEFTAFMEWFYDSPAWKKLLVATNGDPYDLGAKVDEMTSRMRGTADALSAHALHLSKTEEQRDALAARRQQAAQLGTSMERHSA
jgi:transcriptional regulator with XRE-family HTH domain